MTYETFVAGRWFYAAAAIVASALYLWALAPLSGGVGGLYFYLIGWITPNAVPLLIAAFIFTFLPPAGRWSLPIFAAIWFAVGINASAAHFFWPLFASVTTSSHIEKTVGVSHESSWAVVSDSGEAAAATALFGHRYNVEGDIALGIGMYFVSNPSVEHSRRIQKSIRRVTNLPRYATNNEAMSTVKFVLSIVSHDDGRLADFKIGVGRGDLVYSWFRAEGLRYEPYPNFERTKLSDEGFLQRVFDKLLRGNIWQSLLTKTRYSYFPEREFEKFLERAIVSVD